MAVERAGADTSGPCNLIERRVNTIAGESGLGRIKSQAAIASRVRPFDRLCLHQRLVNLALFLRVRIQYNKLSEDFSGFGCWNSLFTPKDKTAATCKTSQLVVLVSGFGVCSLVSLIRRLFRCKARYKHKKPAITRA
jgi:hypothetical protein